MVPNTSTQRLRLRDIAVVTEAPAAGWQVATIVRLLKLPAGHIELGLQVLSRDIDMVDCVRCARDKGSTATTQRRWLRAPFSANPAEDSLFRPPIMGATWIMNTVDYQASVVYEVQGSGAALRGQRGDQRGLRLGLVRPNELS